MSAMFPTVNFLINVSSVAVLWFGATLVNTGQIEVGTLVAYLSYLVQILMSVVMATFMVSMIPRASVSADRIQEVLDTDPSVVPPAAPVREVRQHGALEFRDVGFHYPGAEHAVLSDISFTTAPGTDDRDRRQHRRGQDDAREPHPAAVRQHRGRGARRRRRRARARSRRACGARSGYVPATAVPVLGHRREQPRSSASPTRPRKRCGPRSRSRRPSDFVRAMPGGLNARIEQGGTNVSGGQRQRLSIARALIRQPDIYVFDDSFSALDLATDARLRAALVPYTRDAAVVIVAQRVSTISSADNILVLEDGEVIGSGTHEELLENCATYAEIVQSQIGEKDAA